MAHDALLLIDLQSDWFSDAELDRCREDLVETCNRLVVAAHRSGVPVLEVRTVHEPDRSTWTLTMLEDDQGVTVRGTPGAERVAGLEPGPAAVVEKTRDSVSFGTTLEQDLRAQDVRRVVLCGVSTESCIAASARDAFARDLAVVLVSDATASVSWEEHDHTLAMLHDQHRQEVLTADEVVARWAGATQGPGR
jgi:nicotinamidase-related amidase